LSGVRDEDQDDGPAGSRTALINSTCWPGKSAKTGKPVRRSCWPVPNYQHDEIGAARQFHGPVELGWLCVSVHGTGCGFLINASNIEDTAAHLHAWANST